ncbi:CDP-alcohol phosphatidyltransferase family protein [Halorubrum sp. JWXQ-INN 858]|uniref:CDP-alcohol phosphatidyltransferase family protein n=1 Tax=Halorubrum sp. JWXQ-INN 858 TaxID=2690782 RepID=UPI0013F79976|nr:CDP-alcohol phosphatidyltransferase family protein [Halorubrum sp. JWXQ-INN 858]MWV64607.1 CDP-alcohol phosphatidyltransferase family protein [Halorubrum sp. JWXQ-INN 858]
MTDHATPSDVPRAARQWLGTAGATGLLALAGVGGLAAGWGGTVPPGFLVGSAVAFAFLAGVVWRCLGAARRDAGPEPITGATWITLVRGSAAVVLAGFLVAEPPGGAVAWVPGVLFAAAAALDAVDGAVARATDSVSAVGGRLDVEIDSASVLVGSALAVSYGGAPAAFLLVGFARYAFVAGIHARRRRGRTVSDLDPSDRRRAVGALTMVVTCLVLLPSPGESLSWLLAILVLGPFLASFARDWLVVSGRIEGAH